MGIYEAEIAALQKETAGLRAVISPGYVRGRVGRARAPAAMPDSAIPQTIGEAKASGWAWLAVQCRDYRHGGDIRLDVLLERGSATRLAALAGKLHCGKSEGRKVDVSLGVYLQSGFGQPYAKRFQRRQRGSAVAGVIEREANCHARVRAAAGGAVMSDLSPAQMRRIAPCFPLSHGIPRVDDRRIISGIIFVIRNGLRWRDAPTDYGPHKTIYDSFIRWSRLGVFNAIFARLAAKGGKPDQLMVDATHLKAHRTAASLLEKGLFPDVSGVPKGA